MRNPFFALTEKSVDKPLTVLACLFAVVILLSSGAMHLKFDNSEDGFFPDNETVSLLNDIEDEYQASVDFVRIIGEVDQGDLLVQETWTQLAYIEAQLLLDENFHPYHYP